MAIRYDDTERSVSLSVRDLVEARGATGHLSLSVVQSSAARMAAGRRVHLDLQSERQRLDEQYRAEVRVRQSFAVDDWTVTVQGRVDGLTEEEGRAVVEEIKSTTLDAGGLFATSVEDWPAHTQQLEIYLMMLADSGWDRPLGRLVLVSLVDGSRHVLGLSVDVPLVRAWVEVRLTELVCARKRRIAWMEARRTQEVPLPHEAWRAGQREISESTHWGLDAQHQVVIEAPTGIGKTAAVLHGVLQYALAHDKQVFWATSRTTQQHGVEAALHRFRAAGLSLRTVSINAKEKVCLNERVSCTSEDCRFAEHYYDKLRETRVLQGLTTGVVDRATLEATGLEHTVCPFELALDLSDHVDVVVGDYNYAFEPSVHLKRHFSDTAGDWIVVVDEAHQLVERARAWGSPRIEASLAREALDAFDSDRDRYAPFIALAREIEQVVLRSGTFVIGPSRGGESVVEIALDDIADLAGRLDEVGLDYALLTSQRPLVPAGEADPWVDLARQVLRFHAAFTAAGDETVCLARHTAGRESLALLCLDPSPWLAPRLSALGGLVALSATLSPTAFYRDLLGLDETRLDVVQVPSPFPAENRRVVVAPRVSTAFKDRPSHAPATADLLARCIAATAGNVAVYFPSFAMLRDISSRWSLPQCEVLLQEPAMGDDRRREWLDRLSGGERQVVLGAVLGGIFAEGIDLPPGSLAAVFIAGPALPPVGLERDLLRAHYQERYGEGFRYASLVPGMTKVAQAAGRLIRRPEDRGIVLLVGRRFRWRDYAGLLPSDWDLHMATDPVDEIVDFQRDSM